MFQKFKHLFFLSLLLCGKVFSQSVTVSHALGTSAFLKGETFSQALTYAPRLNFLFFGSGHTVSIGTTTSMAIVFASNAFDEPIVTFDVPLTLDLNLGHASDEDSDAGFGGFVGLGPCYNNIWDYSYQQFNYRKLPGTVGLVFNGGIRFDSYVIGSYTLRGSYMLNFQNGGSNVIGLNVLINLGDI